MKWSLDHSFILNFFLVPVGGTKYNFWHNLNMAQLSPACWQSLVITIPFHRTCLVYIACPNEIKHTLQLFAMVITATRADGGLVFNQVLCSGVREHINRSSDYPII